MRKKKQNKKEEYIEVCPRCKSTNLTSIDYPNISSPMSLGTRCLDCGYEGPLIEVKNSKLVALRKTKKEKTKNKQEKNLGKFILNPIILVWSLVIIITLVLIVAIIISSSK